MIIDNCIYGTKFWCRFGANLETKVAAEIAPSYGAIWDEFSEQR